MTPLARRLCLNGLVLFVFGLILGFAIEALPNPRVALSAHLNAVQSGTFLVALGLLWGHLGVWPRAAALLGNAIWMSFWGLEAGLTLAAFAERGAPSAGVRAGAQALMMASSVAMLLAVGALLIPRPRMP